MLVQVRELRSASRKAVATSEAQAAATPDPGRQCHRPARRNGAGFRNSRAIDRALAFNVHSSAYIGKAVRAAIEGVPVGQAGAVRAFGMTCWQTMRLVVPPLKPSAGGLRPFRARVQPPPSSARFRARRLQRADVHLVRRAWEIVSGNRGGRRRRDIAPSAQHPGDRPA